MRREMIRLAVVVAAVVSATASRSDAAFLTTTDRGWYDQNGSHIVGNANYLTGIIESGPEYRSYYVFNVSGISGTVNSAALSAFNPSNGYSSGDATETLALFDVSTSVSSLGNNTGGVGAFNDLGTGTSYGSVTVSAASNGTFVNVSLNSAGLSALNTAISGSSSFVVGGALTSLSGPTIESQYVFGFSGRRNAADGSTGLNYTLGSTGGAVATPLPPTLLAGFMGMGLLAGVRRLRRA